MMPGKIPGDGYGYDRSIAAGGYGLGFGPAAVRIILRLIGRIPRQIDLSSPIVKTIEISSIIRRT